MIKPITVTIFIILLLACSANKKVQVIQAIPEMPPCLEAKIKVMASDQGEGSPISVTKYSYRQQTVYYVVSPCCDKFNIVYDSACNVLGHPDGGFTGRGDGKMPDFRKEATNAKLIWKVNK
jgi:hypothetical protein